MDEVQIWRAWLDHEGWPAEDSLPDGERRRAESIQIPVRRRRWVAARWALRSALGRHLGSDPAEIALAEGRGGKPEARDHRDVRFNLSHSGELALVAITAGREVGVDIERTDPKRPLAFYRDWVRREAQTKCTGAGILAPPPEDPILVTDITPGPGWAGALALEGSVAMPRRWFDLKPPI